MSINVKSPSPPFIFFVEKCDPPPGSSKIYSDPPLCCVNFTLPFRVSKKLMTLPWIPLVHPPPLLKNECSLKATLSAYLKLEHKSITILSPGNPKTSQKPNSFFEELAYQEVASPEDSHRDSSRVPSPHEPPFTLTNHNGLPDSRSALWTQEICARTLQENGLRRQSGAYKFFGLDVCALHKMSTVEFVEFKN